MRSHSERTTTRAGSSCEMAMVRQKAATSPYDFSYLHHTTLPAV